MSQLLNVRGNALSELRRWSEAVALFRDGARPAWNCLALHELAYVLWNLPRALAHVRAPAPALHNSPRSRRRSGRRVSAG